MIGQVIPGAMLPGNPLGNMARGFAPLTCMQRLTVLQLFKTYSVETISASMLFVQDLKLGHYLKIPPRTSFLVQSISTVLSVTCQIAVKEWMFDTLPGICQLDEPHRLTCPRNRVFYSASVVWYVLHLGTYSLKREKKRTNRRSIFRCM